LHRLRTVAVDRLFQLINHRLISPIPQPLI
jgi:hypothetical protein